MSDNIKHECGIALLRLKKPAEYYLKKYGTSLYGLNKMHLLMEKQHNRGQDGAGLVTIKLDMEPGHRYISRVRSIQKNPIEDIFSQVFEKIDAATSGDREKLKDIDFLKSNCPFTGEILLGHLRYGTFGRNSIENCHPFLRQSNWITRNLVLAGNFNLTNVDQLFDSLIELGQHPKEISDTVTILEKIGHSIDRANDRLYSKFKPLGLSKLEISKMISENLDIQDILKRSSKNWDGGWAMSGIIGNGDAFVFRDPAGIRPAYYFENDEICVVASERPAIQTAFNLSHHEIKELTPGSALIIKNTCQVSEVKILPQTKIKKCSFERIYFSRGTDADIYEERKNLGRFVVDSVIDAIDGDIDNSIFSYIPNTAEVSFYGLMKAIEDKHNQIKVEAIKNLPVGSTDEQISNIIKSRARIEKIAVKDAKLRTFITEDSSREDLVDHVYDVTYGVVNPEKDNLVIIDDSIVRGTTMKNSILKMLDRLNPKKVVVVSSSPQIRYPDCYGIDMAKLGDFIAFEATISLLKERGLESIITEVYEECKSQLELPNDKVVNSVKKIYEPFTDQEISDKISELLRPKSFRPELKIVYQSCQGLNKACPNHTGDWYFTGNYPTPGGNKVAIRSFINWMEKKNVRAY